jgi:hypothetical protein
MGAGPIAAGRRGRRHALGAVAALVLLGGCAGLYFHDAGGPPAAPRYSLDRWPYREYWTGIVFNGQKIGFSHLAIEPAADGSDEFVIRSQAALRFRFLALDKRVNLTAEDRVGPDLRLRRFHYRQNLDDHVLEISGRIAPEALHAEIVAGGERRPQVISLAGPIWPTSAVGLYPVLKGLAVGAAHEYPVYDPETQQLTTVKQAIEGYETSELFEGAAFKLRTVIYGHEATTWINFEGRPLLEIGLGGVLVSGLESEAEAKRSLALAALNKQETLLDYSLVKTDATIETPRRVSALRVALEGMDPSAAPPSDAWQRCVRAGETMTCDIGARPGAAAVLASAERERYLQPTLAAPAAHPQIASLAREIAGQTAAPRAQVEAIVGWIQRNIQRQAVDAFSALDVLKTRKAECQGHSYLYAALARALGIPTRVVNGLVYSEEHRGFLYHTWTESWLDGRWQALDPTFGQIPADATHLKLMEGETPAELIPLLGYLGRTRARVLAVETPAP